MREREREGAVGKRLWTQFTPLPRRPLFSPPHFSAFSFSFFRAIPSKRSAAAAAAAAAALERPPAEPHRSGHYCGPAFRSLSLSISYSRLHHLDQVPSAAAFACSFPYTKSSAPGCPEIRTRASPCFNLNLGSASPTCVTLLHHAAHSADRCTSPMGSDQLRRRLRPQPRCNFLLGWSRFHCTINPIPGHPRSFHPRCTTKPLLRKSGFVQQGASPAAINGHRHASFGWCAEHGTCAPALGTLPGCSSSNNSKASRHPAGAPPSFPHRHRCHARTAHQPQL